MSLTVEQIKDLSNAYEALGTSDALIEHRAVLNSLPEMEPLAQKIIKDCPVDKLSSLCEEIALFQSENAALNAFFNTLQNAYFELALKSEHPFMMLGTDAAFAMYRDRLNALELDGRKALASQMVLQCPEESLNDFGRIIETLRTPHADQDSFHEILFDTYEVKKRILSLLDEDNNHPHVFFLLPEFAPRLFLSYKATALEILDGNENAIASRLALTTPGDKLDALAANVHQVFPNTIFASTLGAAFAVRRDIDHLLSGPHPERFFASREINPSTFDEFSPLLKLIAGKETPIAEKLALNLPLTELSKIMRVTNHLCQGHNILTSELNAAFLLRSNIENLLLKDNPKAFFSSRDTNQGLCQKFSNLFNLTRGKESQIAEKLALTTTAEERHLIGSRVEKLCDRENELQAQIRASFELRTNIEHILLGEHPEEFFEESKGFSADICLQFPTIFPTLINGHEAAIGQKLALQDSAKISQIIFKLEHINPDARSQNSAFRLLASEIMSAAQKNKQSTSASTSDSRPLKAPVSLAARPALFSTVQRDGNGAAAQATLITTQKDAKASSSASDEGCGSRFCGLFS